MIDTISADVIVIGAGVVGLACARKLALDGRDVTIIEAEAQFGSLTSSRNSEVLHAGIYYQQNSLKARLCVAGQAQLYNYCDNHSIQYKKCGKLIVCQNANEMGQLETHFKNGVLNGAPALSLIGGREAKLLEPALSVDVVGAILSPTTGIIDSHSYMISLLGSLEDHSGRIAFQTRAMRGEVVDGSVVLETGHKNALKIKANCVVNAAGHGAVDLARKIDGPHVLGLPKSYFAKGSYFSISRPAPFTRLIYPMPGEAGLGIHLTLDLAGHGKLGPNVEWLPDDTAPPFDYAVNPDLIDEFYEAARNFWPSLEKSSLKPDYSGVRSKVVGANETAGDFIVDAQENSGLINLFGIESPGLTASLALADYVAQIASQK